MYNIAPIDDNNISYTKFKRVDVMLNVLTIITINRKALLNPTKHTGVRIRNLSIIFQSSQRHYKYRMIIMEQLGNP